MHYRAALFVAGILSLTTVASAVPSDVFTPVPGVTVEMEKDFLARYKAAIANQDTNAYARLFVSRPPSEKRFREMARGGLAIDASIANPAYTFVVADPGRHRLPSQIDAKTYVDDMPTVLTLKASASGSAPKAGQFMGSSQPVGLTNGQLVFVGMREDDHAIVPPAPAPAPASPNYNLKPNVRPPSDEDAQAFGSLAQFLSAAGQPSLETLTSGQNDLVYFVVYRLQPNLLIYADANRHADANYMFRIQIKDSSGTLWQPKTRWIDLVDNELTGFNGPQVQGTVFKVPAGYHGTLTVNGDYTPGGSNKTITVSRTIDWK